MSHDLKLARFAEIQRALIDLIAPLDELDCCTQFHPDLSPLGWHLGHTTFIENQWIREVILKSNRATTPVCNIYLPQNINKAARGECLPPKSTLLESCRRMQHANLALLESPPGTLVSHRLMRDDYLLKFLIQHHAMHLETMHMILTERQLRRCWRDYSPQKRLEPVAMRARLVTFDGSEFAIGGTGTWCFDNELPQHCETLRPFALNATAATNAEFLGFIESGGYRNTAWWNTDGLKWLQRTGATAPHHWRNDDTGAWYGIDSHGCHDLKAEEPVHGLSHHEACAFARYAGARLPHESEWEAARLQNPGGKHLYENERAWEWCSNTFHPYLGFKTFPYEEYSTSGFNGSHYSLRGYSRYTADVLRRPTFRNFYTADKRHIFAGVRVAMA